MHDNGQQAFGRSALVRAGAALLAAIAAVVTLFLWSSARAEVSQQRDAAVSQELLAHRVVLARANMDELNRVLLAALADGGVLPDNGSDIWWSTVQVESAAIETLAGGSEPVATEAAAVLEPLQSWGPTSSELSLERLSSGFYIPRFEAVPTVVGGATPAAAVAEIVWADESLVLTLNEVAIALLARSGHELDSGADVFVQETYGSILGFGGGYIGDPSQGLIGSVVPLDRARTLEAETLDAIGELAASTDAVEADRWLQELGEDPDRDLPVDLDAYVTGTAIAVEEIRTLVDGRLAAEMVLAADSVDAATTAARLRLAAAVVLVAVAIYFAATAAIQAWRRSGAVRRLASTDPLTGVGNRNLLTEQTAAMLYSDRLKHHVMVTIDLDRFKVINDTFGHSAGDRVLIRVADGLRRIASSAEVDERSVIRLGGDEFVISFHCTRPIDSGRIRQQLEYLRAETIAVDQGTSVALEFSFGLVEAAGSPPLSQLMDASDLAAYEEKALRRSLPGGAGRRQPGPGSVGGRRSQDAIVLEEPSIGPPL